MKKLKLLGIGKSDRHNHYLFPKTQKFFTLARELLCWIGLDRYEWNSFGRPKDKKYGEPIFDREERISSYTDRIFTFEKNGYYVEIIFGQKKVFLSVHTEQDKQQQLSEFISRFVKK